jgi:hypothetical protein
MLPRQQRRRGERTQPGEIEVRAQVHIVWSTE